MKVDIYTHIVPPKYKDYLAKRAHGGGDALDFIEPTPTVWNLDERFRIMDKFPDVVQVLTLAAHTPSDVCGPKEALELSMQVNDEMAELVHKYPDRFAGAVAVVPLNDIDAALKELDRAINDLHLRGLLIRVPINGKSPDKPEFMPLYEAMAGYNLPIWLHPQRQKSIPDYPTEEGGSMYRIWHLWGLVYETTVAMTRLALSGVLQKYPNLKFITHHCGAMVPFFSGRIEQHYDKSEMRMPPDWNYSRGLAEKPVEYFRRFYNDTVTNGNPWALMCGYHFFGPEHILFGTDFPMGDAQVGFMETRRTIEAIEQMAIPDIDKQKIFCDNARRLCRLPL